MYLSFGMYILIQLPFLPATACSIDSGKTIGIFHGSANVTPYFMVEDSL